MDSVCKYCGKPLRWAKSTKGRNIPLDVEPSERGNIKLADGIAYTFDNLEALTLRQGGHDLYARHDCEKPRRSPGDGVR